MTTFTSGESQSPSSLPPLQWKLSQVFGDRIPGEDVQDGTVRPVFSVQLILLCRVWLLIILLALKLLPVDIISALGFDKSGDHLAVGDRGGRVVIFERKDGKDVRPSNSIYRDI